MDIGLLINQAIHLYMIIWNASFTIYGISFTYGQIITYGLFLTVVIAFINYLRE